MSEEWQNEYNKWICTGCKRVENQPYYKPKEKEISCCPDSKYVEMNWIGKVNQVVMINVLFTFDGEYYTIANSSHPLYGKKYIKSDLTIEPFLI